MTTTINPTNPLNATHTHLTTNDFIDEPYEVYGHVVCPNTDCTYETHTQSIHELTASSICPVCESQLLTGFVIDEHQQLRTQAKENHTLRVHPALVHLAHYEKNAGKPFQNHLMLRLQSFLDAALTRIQINEPLTIQEVHTEYIDYHRDLRELAQNMHNVYDIQDKNEKDVVAYLPNTLDTIQCLVADEQYERIQTLVTREVHNVSFIIDNFIKIQATYPQPDDMRLTALISAPRLIDRIQHLMTALHMKTMTPYEAITHAAHIHPKIKDTIEQPLPVPTV